MDIKKIELLDKKNLSEFTESEKEQIRNLFDECHIYSDFGFAEFRFEIGYGLFALLDGAVKQTAEKMSASITFDDSNHFRFYDKYYGEIPYSHVLHRLTLIDEIENLKLELKELFEIIYSDETRASTYFNSLENELPNGFFDRNGEINTDYNLEHNFDNLLKTYKCMLTEKIAVLIDNIHNIL